MSQPVLIKVYGSLFPADGKLAAQLKSHAASAIGETPCPAIVDMDGELLRISFEGVYFPVDEFLEAIGSYLAEPEHSSASGKLDVLDVEGWELKRYLFENARIMRKSAPLNNVFDYSGH